MARWTSFLTTLPAIIFLISSVAESAFEESNLTRDLMKKYHETGAQGRPVSDPSNPIQVSFGATLQQILNFDPEQQTITTLFWLNMHWHDDILTWNPKDYGGVKSVRLWPRSVFIPDILPYNGIPPMERFDTRVVVSSDGGCLWVPPVKLTSSCKVPIDWQADQPVTCTLKYGSWTWDGTGIDLTLNGNTMDTSSYLENRSWRLLSTSAQRHVVSYDCCPESYIDVTFNMTLQKRV